MHILEKNLRHRERELKDVRLEHSLEMSKLREHEEERVHSTLTESRAEKTVAIERAQAVHRGHERGWCQANRPHSRCSCNDCRALDGVGTC